MPARNARKIYAPDSYYHIYNRGVEKRIIFADQQDYAVYLSYLRTYLLPKDQQKLQQQLANPSIGYRERQNILRLLRLNNFNEEINLLAYCLMPNHFHFLIKQREPNAIDRFMNSLQTRYVMYFNSKYKRRGPLFENVYKAVLVESDEQLLYLTAYIHRNPLPSKVASKGVAFRASMIAKQPTSYLDYIGERKTPWIHPKEILVHFSGKYPSLSYQSFVINTKDYSLIEDLNIDYAQS